MAFHLAAGTLDQLITISAPPTGEDDLGQPSGDWIEVGTYWARAEPLRGRELIAAAEVRSEATVRFRMRYRSDITAAMRVTWRGKVYDIVSDPIDVEGARVALELMCKSGRAP